MESLCCQLPITKLSQVARPADIELLKPHVALLRSVLGQELIATRQRAPGLGVHLRVLGPQLRHQLQALNQVWKVGRCNFWVIGHKLEELLRLAELFHLGA